MPQGDAGVARPGAAGLEPAAVPDRPPQGSDDVRPAGLETARLLPGVPQADPGGIAARAVRDRRCTVRKFPGAASPECRRLLVWWDFTGPIAPPSKPWIHRPRHPQDTPPLLGPDAPGDRGDSGQTAESSSWVRVTEKKPPRGDPACPVRPAHGEPVVPDHEFEAVAIGASAHRRARLGAISWIATSYRRASRPVAADQQPPCRAQCGFDLGHAAVELQGEESGRRSPTPPRPPPGPGRPRHPAGPA